MTPLPLLVFVLCLGVLGAVEAEKTGVLLVIGGTSATGRSSEDREIFKIQKEIEKAGYPTAVSLNLSDVRVIERAFKTLENRGVKEVVAVPLLITSQLEDYEQLEYLLGLRQEPSQDFLKGLESQNLTHKSWGVMGSDEERKKKKRFTIRMLWEKDKPREARTALERQQLKTKLKVRLSPALGNHPYVAEILLDRAKKLSRDPKKEVVALISWAPFNKARQEARRVEMNSIAHQIKELGGFFDVRAFSLHRDVSAAAQKNRLADLRLFAGESARAHKKVIILPLTFSRDRLGKDAEQVLSGLFYKMGQESLLTHPKIAKWVLEKVMGSRLYN